MQLRKFIRTILKEQIEEAYPPSFSMEEFKNIGSFTSKLKYADTHLQKLASGTARTAYKIDDEKVLKVAKNPKGIAQNRNETDWHKQNYDIIARVFDYDPDDYWLEMELAKKVTRSSFKNITGLSIEDVDRGLRYLSLRDRGAIRLAAPPENMDEIKNNEFFQELANFIADYGLFQAAGDYGRLSSYGEVMRNGKPTIVAIDFGVDDYILTHLYKKG